MADRNREHELPKPDPKKRPAAADPTRKEDDEALDGYDLEQDEGPIRSGTRPDD